MQIIVLVMICKKSIRSLSSHCSSKISLQKDFDSQFCQEDQACHQHQQVLGDRSDQLPLGSHSGLQGPTWPSPEDLLVQLVQFFQGIQLLQDLLCGCLCLEYQDHQGRQEGPSVTHEFPEDKRRPFDHDRPCSPSLLCHLEHHLKENEKKNEEFTHVKPVSPWSPVSPFRPGSPIRPRFPFSPGIPGRPYLPGYPG